MNTPRVISPRDASARRGGFALVIALSLMAFILVLLLTLTSLVRVETSSAQNQLAQLQARQNARLGALIALGELQKTMGPDTRVSAPTISDTAPANTQWIIGAFDAAPYVYDASGNLIFNDNFGKPTQYLISSRDPRDFDPTNTDPSVTFNFEPFNSSGRVNSDYAVLVGTGALGLTDQNRDNLPDNLADIQDADSDGIDDRYVAAPLIDFDDKNKAAFAWWVSDEGQKAQVNLTDPFRNSASMGDARAQATTAQRVGTEAIFDAFDSNNDAENELLERVTSSSQLGLTGFTTTATAKSAFHEITTNSAGLLTNTRRGGLMRDLTAVMEEAANNGGAVNVSGGQWLQLMAYQRARLERWRDETTAIENYVGKPHHLFDASDRTGDPILSELPERHWNSLRVFTLREEQANPLLADKVFPPMTDTSAIWDMGGAPWEQIITWPTLKQRSGLGSGEIRARGRTEDSLELTPVISKALLATYVAADWPESSLHWIPSIALWNPYDTPIRMNPAKPWRVVFRYSLNEFDISLRLRVSHPDWNVFTAPFKPTADYPLNSLGRRPELNSTSSNFSFNHIPDSSVTGGSLMWTPRFAMRWDVDWNENDANLPDGNFVFHLRDAGGGTDVTIPPGEALVFTMHENVDVTPSDPADPLDPTVMRDDIVLRVGVPDDRNPFQYSLYRVENLADQLRDHPYGGSWAPITDWRIEGLQKAEPSGGYNQWHAWTSGGGNFRSRPMALPYPFPLSHPENDGALTPTTADDDPNMLDPNYADFLFYDAANAPVNANLVVNKNGLANWTIEGAGLEFGNNQNDGQKAFGGLLITLDEGNILEPLFEISHPNMVAPTDLSNGRLSDIDNIYLSQILPVFEPQPVPGSDPLVDVNAAFGFSFGLRLPENGYSDPSMNQELGAEGVVAPVRWLTDFNPTNPYQVRDPSSRLIVPSGGDIRKIARWSINKANALGGFLGPPSFIGGFFPGGSRFDKLAEYMANDVNHSIGSSELNFNVRAVLFEIPDDKNDIVSVASLMHTPLVPTPHDLMPADLIDFPQLAHATYRDTDGVNRTSTEAKKRYLARASVAYGALQPAYAIGNSEASMILERDRAEQSYFSTQHNPTPASHAQSVPYLSAQHPLVIGETASTIAGSFAPIYDASWTYNEAMWDDFFFTPETNSRIVWSGGTGASDREFNTSAENVRVNGAFNVNSVSVGAWASILSSMMNVNLNTGESPDGFSPFSRFINPLDSAFDPNTHDPDVEEAYAGYRRLSSNEIWDKQGTPDDLSDDTGLAVEIVNQVKERGPFLSMADFVNRALVANDPLDPAVTDTLGHGKSGAIQTAIANAEINNAMGTTADLDFWIDPTNAYDAARVVVRTHGDLGSAFDGLPIENAEGARSASAPGALTQADLLARIGAVLRPRSDTFIIRAKGITGDSDSPTAVAWCEIEVQRTEQFVESAADGPDALPVNLTSNTNRSFGRRFDIVSFRWLTEDEI